MPSGKQQAPQQRKMLPGEKERRRKEVIARKRLERAQDKDGLHIEVCILLWCVSALARAQMRPCA